MSSFFIPHKYTDRSSESIAGTETLVGIKSGSKKASRWSLSALRAYFFNVATGGSHTLKVNSTTEVTVDATGINLASGNVLKVNGTQVVGAQGAAVADATDAASAITQLNAALARLRAHGLIAT